MATAGFYIAEAHVMRKLHKEKMKRMEEEERVMAEVGVGAGIEARTSGSPVKKTSKCLWIFKKVHPSQILVNLAQEEEKVGKWDSRGL